MSNIRYVVAGLPRSGTKYIAKVLSGLGLDCGHENYFRLEQCISTRPVDGVWGDSSWMVAPYIYRLPPGTIVFHQLRDPLKVLNSNLPIGGDSYFRTWDESAGLAEDPLYGKAIPYKRFIWDNTQDWVWPTGVAEGPESAEEIERLMHWWMSWNLWIEYATLQRSDLQYFRYKLEAITADSWILKIIAEIINPGNPKSEEEVQEALAAVSVTTNRHREPNTLITPQMIPISAQVLMYRYGYDS